MGILDFFSSEQKTDLAQYSGSDRFNFTLSESDPVKLVNESDEPSTVDLRYQLIKPFAEAHIYWDEEEKRLNYDLEEPELTDREQQVSDKIKENLSEKIEVSLSSIQDREKTVGYLEEKVNELLLELGLELDEASENRILYYIYRDFVGINKAEPLMHDPYIEDIGCDGVGTPLFVVHSEFGSLRTDISFEDEDRLENLVVKLAERCGKYVSYADPLLDGALPDGSRVNASLTRDVTAKGPTFSIRKFQEDPFSAIDIMNLGTANAEIMAYMWILYQYDQSIMVVGGTSTGKTTFLNSTVSFIPPEEKIVSIEDTRELRLPHENWIPSITREQFGGSGTEVDMDQLLEESFRQNPDYVVVGEVRGEEASVLFQGMSSGHPSIGTMHASSPSSVVKRLVTPPISLSPALVEALDCLVVMTHAKGVEESARRVKSVHELQKVIGESASARTNEAFEWTARTDSYNRRGVPFLFEQINQDYGIPKDKLMDELENRKKLLKWLQRNDIKDFDVVADIIAEYYKNKDRLLNMVESDDGGDMSLDQILDTKDSLDIDTGSDNQFSVEEEQGSDSEQSESPQQDQNEETEERDRPKNPYASEENPVKNLQDRIQQIQKEFEQEVSDLDESENPFNKSEEKVSSPFEK